MTYNKLIFIFSRDNSLSNTSNLLPMDLITALYALPGSLNVNQCLTVYSKKGWNQDR